MKRNIKLTVAYDGTRYQGFQRLGHTDNTIQEKLEICLSRLLEEEIQVIGSSRTDAGVHALEQVVNFYTEHPMEVLEMKHHLNRYLPEDIVIKDSEVVPDNFHSRYWNEKKTYLYRIHTNQIPPVFERKYVYNLGKSLDVIRMRTAAALLIGEKDFQGFCNKNMKKSSVRSVDAIEIIQTETEVQVYLTANGFLYNMVRIIVGTLIEIGLHEREIGSIHEILDEKVRAQAGYLVPAQGLILYRNHFLDKSDKA